MIKRLTAPLSFILFIITCAICGWYLYASYSIIPFYKKHLSTIANNRLQEINTFLDEQEKYAIQLSQEQIVIDALHNSRADNVAALIISHKETMEFRNIFLIDKDKKIIFSTTKKDLVGTVLTEEPSSLAKSYERATMTLTNDFSNFNFNELLQEPALFITIPILKDKKYIGTLSYQLEAEKIYLITNQYIGLGKTGEVALGKKEGEYAIFLFPTRNDPDIAFKKRALFTYPPLSIQASILGQEGSGTAVDYRGKKVVGSWKFIPRLDWGMIVKIDINEIIQSIYLPYTLFLLFLVLFVLSMTINAYIFRHRIHYILIRLNASLKSIPSLAKNPLFIISIIFFGFTIKNIIQCSRQKSFAIEKTQKQAQENNEKNSENITKILEKIAFIGQSIAKDLETNYLKKDDITTRIERDLAENNIITDITIALISDDQKITQVQTTSSDTVVEKAITQTHWYTQALKKNSSWIVNTPSETQTATYACIATNTNKKASAVIAITFSLKTIVSTTELHNIGQTGYSIITAEDGTFIYHPISTLVTNEMTLLQFAQSQGNEVLASIAEKSLDGKPLLSSYTSSSSNGIHWVATQPIPTNNWIIGTIFSENEVGLSPQKIRHYYFWILLWFILTAISFISLLFYTHRIISEIFYTAMINILLLLGIIAAWYAITITHTISNDSIVIITDQSSLDKFLNDLNEEADRKHEPKPITVPCGLLLYSINIPDPDHMEISGYLWSKYNTLENKDITRGIDILQSTRMAIGKPITSNTGSWETETWTVQGVLSQDPHNVHYPFDQPQLRIIFEHRDIEKNIILTPDLAGYKKISPETMPGLDKDFAISGFNVEETFFEYKFFDPKANFGFKEYGKVTDHFQLIYNVILSRNLLNPFVIYILPLLVILFTLFCTLLISGRKTDPFSMLGTYTGLFFSLIILQRSLREQLPSGSTLYIEYAFFYTYITIILLVLHTILNHFSQHKIRYQEKAFHMLKLLFWPFQLVSWLITTILVFY